MIHRRRPLYLAILMTVFSVTFAARCAIAQEDSVPEEPTLTVRITPPKPYLQEQIVQVVRLIAPHPFEELVLDLPPVEGAEMITLQQPKNRKFETYGGEGYIYETSRAIFPKQSGHLRIPPIRISGSIGISRDEKLAFAVRSDAAVLDVRAPPDGFSEDWWLVAREVKIDEGWSVPLDTLRVGDRVTRSIAVTVAGVTGAHLPELTQGRSTGLTVLPGRTERSTEITPGGVIGKVSRSFDIRVDIDQPINVSPVRVVWWNTDTEIERRSAAPAIRLEPLPRDVEQLVSAAMADAVAARSQSRWGIITTTLGGSLLLIGVVFWLFKKRQKVRPEDRLLRSLVQEDGRPINVVRALKSWAEATFPDEPGMTLEALGKKLGPAAEQRLSSLQHAAFGASAEPIDAAGLALAVIDIAQKQRRHRQDSQIAVLLDRLLGQERRLPDLDLSPKRRA